VPDSGNGDSNGEAENGRKPTVALIAAVKSDSIDEADFLEQLDDDQEDSDSTPPTVDGTELTDWEFAPFDDASALQGDPSNEGGYPTSGGSIERPGPLGPTVEWKDLEQLKEQVRSLESRAGRKHSRCADLFDRLIERRRVLWRYRSSIPFEG